MSKKEANYDIYIFTEGGREFGYGHIVRCISLYDELSTRGHHPIFIINGDENVSNVLAGRKFRLDQWYGKTKDYLTHIPYSITDSYHADLEDYSTIAFRSRQALFIDDYCRLDYPVGVIVNPSIHGDKISYQQKAGQTYLLGKDYIILRKEFRDFFARKTRENVKDILVLMGGSDVKSITPIIIKTLDQNNSDQEYTVHVVVGNGVQSAEEIIEASKHTNIEIYYNLDALKLRRLMADCDLAVSTAGQSIHELISMKLPFICIQIADNQINNVLGLIDLELVEGCMDLTRKEFEPAHFMDLFNNIKASDQRKEISAKMSSFNIMLGTENIINNLIK